MRLKWMCQRCGHSVYPGDGYKTDLGGKFDSPKFFCNPCMNKVEQEERTERLKEDQARHQSFEDVRAWALKRAAEQPKPKDRDKLTLIKTLSELCPKADWYKLAIINERFEATAGYRNCDTHLTSNLLNEIGFKQRKRMKRGSYTYAYIDPALLPPLAANAIKQ
jgi:phage terminase large subunit GpA-like protein